MPCPLRSARKLYAELLDVDRQYILEYLERVALCVRVAATDSTAPARSDQVMVVPELVGQYVEQLVGADLGFGPTNVERASPGLVVDAEEIQELMVTFDVLRR